MASSTQKPGKTKPKDQSKPKPKAKPKLKAKTKRQEAGRQSAREVALGEGKPLCFVLMPFGKKHDARRGRPIDFDRIYGEAIRPAIEAAGMTSIREDAETTGGIIHKTMFEHLLLCDYAVADLTTANPNVFYELGVRHAARPRTTVAIFARGKEIPFDVRLLRQLPYQLGADNEFEAAEAKALARALQELLVKTRQAARDAVTDSPLYQLLQGYKPPQLAHLVTDSFRDQARYSENLRRALTRARAKPAADGLGALRAIERKLGPELDGVVPGVLVDLYLSYRAVSGWDAMIDLYERFPPELQQAVVVREQLAFALNRRKQPGDGELALEILNAVEQERGANPETCGLLGRIYKDRWQAALDAGNHAQAAGSLDQAIAAYVRGYEADWRDAYPGVNSVTLLDVRGTADDLARRDQLAPVVQYAVDRKIAGSAPDYWDFASQLELAVVRSDRPRAEQYLGRAAGLIREGFQPLTTANNLKLIADARAGRGEDAGWVRRLMDALEQAHP